MPNAFSLPYIRYELPLPPALRPPSANAGEVFTGQVNGKKASDLEERFARALRKEGRVEYFIFRMLFGQAGMLGSFELDFYIKAGSWYPVQLDQDWLHKSASAQALDMLRDDQIWKALRHDNPQVISRIRGSLIQTPEQATSVINQLLAGRVFRTDSA